MHFSPCCAAPESSLAPERDRVLTLRGRSGSIEIVTSRPALTATGRRRQRDSGRPSRRASCIGMRLRATLNRVNHERRDGSAAPVQPLLRRPGCRLSGCERSTRANLCRHSRQSLGSAHGQRTVATRKYAESVEYIPPRQSQQSGDVDMRVPIGPNARMSRVPLDAARPRKSASGFDKVAPSCARPRRCQVSRELRCG